MAINCVTPSRRRVYSEKDETAHLTPEYIVDVPALPELVARGVMPFRFLRMRKDFATRFAGCEDAGDVIKVLSAEGYWDVNKSVSDVDSSEQNVDIGPEFVDKSVDRDAGVDIDRDYKKIADPVERRRAYLRIKKREERKRKADSS